MTQFEILIYNQDNLLGCIYKLLLKYVTETEHIKHVQIVWETSKKLSWYNYGSNCRTNLSKIPNYGMIWERTGIKCFTGGIQVYQ